MCSLAARITMGLPMVASLEPFKLTPRIPGRAEGESE